MFFNVGTKHFFFLTAEGKKNHHCKKWNITLSQSSFDTFLDVFVTRGQGSHDITTAFFFYQQKSYLGPRRNYLN